MPETTDEDAEAGRDLRAWDDAIDFFASLAWPQERDVTGEVWSQQDDVVLFVGKLAALVSAFLSSQDDGEVADFIAKARERRPSHWIL